jgi:hypothetical protein
MINSSGFASQAGRRRSRHRTARVFYSCLATNDVAQDVRQLWTEETSMDIEDEAAQCAMDVPNELGDN